MDTASNPPPTVRVQLFFYPSKERVFSASDLVLGPEQNLNPIDSSLLFNWPPGVTSASHMASHRPEKRQSDGGNVN